jgi:Na+-transporting NADH:ubiquinone oxidoreductase subunit NqrB
VDGSQHALAGDGPKIKVGAATVPIVLPRVTDARLHIAAVIMSIHVLGQVALGFRISVPQILAAIVSAALVEVSITLVRERRLVWPASAMLTGSGVALILRDVGTEAGDHWTTRHWWLFAAVAVGSLLSKYLIRWNGTHVFNPSNLGLVIAFLVLGSGRVEPLDFWWGPFDVSMLVAYWVIVAGGLLITDRLGLLELAAAFWVTFAILMGALALVGHCFVAPWSATPVCDGRFWWTVVTSPEVLIFVFFMITDPKTVPAARRARIVFGVAVAVASSVLIAPQTTEFGAKVGLLGGLVLVCAARPIAVAVERRIEHPFRGRPAWAAVGAASVVALAAVAAAGLPARSVDTQLGVDGLVHPRALVPDIDPARVPAVTVDPAVVAFGDDVPARAGEIATELVRALDVEALAVRHAEVDLLRSVDHGSRLSTMRETVASAGEATVTIYDFERMHLTVARAGGQAGSRLAIEGSGTVTETTAGEPDRRRAFATTFALRPGEDGRWFLVDTWSDDASDR